MRWLRKLGVDHSALSARVVREVIDDLPAPDWTPEPPPPEGNPAEQIGRVYGAIAAAYEQAAIDMVKGFREAQDEIRRRRQG